MRKALFTLLCLAAMMSVGTSLKAQEILIALDPGWNWISYPNAEIMGIATAFGSFTPMQGDIVRSKEGGQAFYNNGIWVGSLKHLIPGRGYHYYSARTEYTEFVFAQPASDVVATAMPTDVTATSAVVGGMVILPEGSHVFLRGVCWGTAPSPDIDGDHTTDGTGIGSFTGTLEGLNPNTTYYVRAYAVSDNGLAYGNEVSFITLEGSSGGDHAYVDLGLPSGTLWATCNVGADAPEDYGDYFAWGETQPKEIYDLSTYQYSNGGDVYNPNFTKYCTNSSYGYNGFTDNLTTLLPEDDAATVNWGTDWRMPSPEECEELYQNTTHTWTTLNGVNGRLFTGSNGNSLFLPAAGACFYITYNSVGIDGYCWTNALYADNPMGAWYFYFFSGYCSVNGGGYRENGIPVRAVRVTPQNTAPTGAIDGLFSVNDSLQVYFSQGNLQYQASTNTWKFAEHQYDYVGNDNNNISSTYNGWIDLFGWGTSGYNHGAICYQPWSTSTTYSDYYAYGDSFYGLYDQTGQADWGYNPISNGGNQTHQWRTLTNAEWGYVFNTRNTASGIRYAKAKVNGMDGIILLPDEWNTSTYNLNNTNSSSASFSSNVITASTWSILEQAGAVFLPAAGVRSGTSVDMGSYGYYWSASVPNHYYAFYVDFRSSYLNTNKYNSRFFGQSVRLVTVSENPQTQTYTISISANPADGGTVTGGGSYEQGQNCTVTATANEGYAFTNWTEDGEVVSTEATYTFNVDRNRNLVANFAASGSGGDHDYVDLGLPSGLLWATCNVGANVPEDYGDYFAWGETQPKDTYTWSTYQYCNGSYGTLTKYCSNSSYGNNGFTDNLTTLLPEDDVARANWGSDWRMPTKEECQELYNNTTCIWTEQNGVNGRLFTATNGNSLFLPAAGCREGSGLYDTGSLGYYWSSSLDYTNPTYAWFFGFFSGRCYLGRDNRDYGFTVRAVRSSAQGNVPAGAIDGKFTINDSGDQVYFSQGNLQYIGSASTPYWKFADNQWDVLGTTTSQNSSNQNVDRDLFGWGTSGYNHGANCYQPWSTSTSYSDYYAYGSYTYNLYDQTGQADWGYNPISNGGNQANQWRTLTKNEWAYVFNTRTTSSGIRYAKASVNNVNGVILLPDDWNTSYYTLSNTNSTGASFSSNTITAEQWSTLEQHGVVFLPTAGHHNGTSVYLVGSFGSYWSASSSTSDYAFGVYFYDSSLYPQYGDRRYYGFSVRLARVAEN